MKKSLFKSILFAAIMFSNLLINNSIAFAVQIPETVRIGVVTVNKSSQFKNASYVSFQVKGSYQLIDTGGIPGLNVIGNVSEGENWQVYSLAAGVQILKDGQPVKTTTSAVAVKEISHQSDNRVNLIECGTGTSTTKIGKWYRGDMEFNTAGSSIVATNQLPIDEYLYGVVPREMSREWPIEALKAQAIAARTYTIANFSKHIAEGYNLIDTPADQVYGGSGSEGTSSTKAVQETAGKVALYNGKPISAVYHSTSGGVTESNENVWGGQPADYLRSKADPYSKIDGFANWTYTTTLDEVRNKLVSSGVTMGKIVSFELSKYPSGRVKFVMIQDDVGDTIMKSGSDFGKLFNPGFYTYLSNTNFMSNFFDVKAATASTSTSLSVIDGNGKIQNLGNASIYGVSADGTTSALNSQTVYVADASKTTSVMPAQSANGTVVFTGHGWGHGVGMSQWGAYRMALAGKSYEEILKFYYEGIVISN